MREVYLIKAPDFDAWVSNYKQHLLDVKMENGELFYSKDIAERAISVMKASFKWSDFYRLTKSNGEVQTFHDKVKPLHLMVETFNMMPKHAPVAWWDRGAGGFWLSEEATPEAHRQSEGRIVPLYAETVFTAKRTS